MSRVIIFSRVFPSYHPRNGEATFFPEKIMAAFADIIPDYIIPDEMVLWDWYEYYNAVPKWHTIRAGNRWKVGDKFSPRIWSGKPYRSKQISLGPDIEVKKVWEIEIDQFYNVSIPSKNTDLRRKGYRYLIPSGDVARNDGLSYQDFKGWFPKGGTFQIICWNEHIKY